MPQAGYKSHPLFKMFTMNNLTRINTKTHTARYNFAFRKKTEEFVQKKHWLGAQRAMDVHGRPSSSATSFGDGSPLGTLRPGPGSERGGGCRGSAAPPAGTHSALPLLPAAGGARPLGLHGRAAPSSAPGSSPHPASSLPFINMHRPREMGGGALF